MNKTRCLICGMSMLADAKSYEAHIEQRHSMDGYSVKIKPVRTTDRTHDQIVHDMEKGPLAKFIVEANIPVKAQTQAVMTASYCAPAGQEGCSWENNGFEICGPCAQIRAAEQMIAH